jgi:hypothetical protein
VLHAPALKHAHFVIVHFYREARVMDALGFSEHVDNARLQLVFSAAGAVYGLHCPVKQKVGSLEIGFFGHGMVCLPADLAAQELTAKTLKNTKQVL